MNPALETLMLVFSGENRVDVPRRALFLGAQPHPDLKAWPDVTGWQPFKPMADAWENAGFAMTSDLPEGKWPVVLVLPGKSRDEVLAWFAIARDRMEPGGRIVVAMPNTAGAGRFEKEFSHSAGNIHSIQKHKCRAFHAVENGAWDESIFDEWRSLVGLREIPGTGFVTQAGIFSSGHVDPGSELLASHLPARVRGRVADLGAGWGFLSDSALRRCPGIAVLDLFEADSRALDCARINLAARHSGAIRTGSVDRDAVVTATIGFHWHDVTAGLPGKYDAILMNPPFHTGQATDVDLGREFLKVAAASLVKGGGLFLVANRQLPYETVLDSLGLSWRKVDEDKVYKVIFADKR